MAIKIEYLDVARDEYYEAVQWDLSRSKTAAAKFKLNYKSTIREIAAYPDRFPIITKDIREIFVEGFPYSIFYRVVNNRIRIISVFQQSRRPRGWMDRSE